MTTPTPESRGRARIMARRIAAALDLTFTDESDLGSTRWGNPETDHYAVVFHSGGSFGDAVAVVDTNANRSIRYSEHSGKVAFTGQPTHAIVAAVVTALAECAALEAAAFTTPEVAR